MKLLNILLEDATMQEQVQINEEQILEAADVYATFPEELKLHISENLETFIGSDVQETYANVKTFVEGAVFQLLHEMTDQVAAAPVIG